MTGFERVAATAEFGEPYARKTGRDRRWPYVPVVVLANGSHSQVLGLAYATRPEALAAAERHIAEWRADLARKLAEPRYRALRVHYGLPAELVPGTDLTV